MRTFIKTISSFCFLLLLITSCSGSIPSPQPDQTPVMETAIAAARIEAAKTLTATAPTTTPYPTLPPVYSSFPAISAPNATRVININRYRGEVNSLAFSPNGKYLAATFENGVGILWDISTARGWEEWEEAPKKLFLSKGQVSFNFDSTILATDGTLLELPSMEVIQELPGTVSFNPINQTLALADWMTLSLWNPDRNQWVSNHRQDSEGVVSIAFSPDGSLLGEALHWGGGEGVNIWRLSDHTLLYSLPPIEHNHPAHFNTLAYAFLAFSPDNQFIITGTKDFPYQMRIWNLQTGKLAKDLDTSADCVAFSQDAQVIILSEGNRITFRAFPNGDIISELEVEIFYMSPTDYVTACATSKDGRLLAIGDSGGNVNIWGIPIATP